MRVRPATNPNLLSTQQAADYLSMAPGTLANWRVSGIKRLPYLKIGFKVLYRKADLDAWLMKNTRTHT